MNDLIHKCCILFGIAFFFRLLQVVVDKSEVKNVPALWNASFFIFAMHEPFQRLLRKVVFKVVQPNSEQMLILLYFTIPLIVISIACVLFYFFNKKTPRLIAFITGGRAIV